MYFNYLRFGSILQFGYIEDRARFVLDVAQITKAVAAYLVSPGLSIFLFAPPLILALLVGRQAYRRWPLETTTLIVASVAHLLLISSMKTWSGDLSFGPRFMLESIVLLMPLTCRHSSWPSMACRGGRQSRWPAVMFLGFTVQLFGILVSVAVIEHRRIAAGVAAHNAWAFVLSVSPFVCDLEELVARRNLSPWAIRALAIPDEALLLLIVLIAIVLLGARRILQYFRAPEELIANHDSRVLPVALVLAAVAPILIGFAIVRPVTEAPNVQAFEFLNAGIAEQRAGRTVSAEEDFAMVLSLFPTNEFANFDMGVLEQNSGRYDDAITYYEKALKKDPNFAPAQQNLEYIARTRFGFSNQHPR